jgi:hypothetical protein
VYCVARQKEKANSSVSELVEAVSKRPRSLSESTNHLPFIKTPKSVLRGGGNNNDHATKLHKKLSNSSRRKSESTLPSFRRKSHSGSGVDTFNSMHSINELPENKNNSRRRSFMGYVFLYLL